MFSLAFQIGTLFILLSIPIWLFIGYKVYRVWQSTNRSQSLYFAGGLITGAISVAGITIDQISLRINYVGVDPVNNHYIGTPIIAGIDSILFALIFAYLAYALALIATAFFEMFALSFLSLKWFKLIIPLALLMLISALIFYFTPDWWQINSSGTDFPLSRDPFNLYAIITLLFLPLAVPVLILLSSTIHLRSESTFAFRRSLILTIGQFLVGLGFIMEVVNSILINNIEDLFFTIGRFFIMIYPILMFIALYPTERTKRILGYKG